MARKRAKASGETLNSAEAAVVKGMLKRGDREHDIAAFFGVNSGRIAEINHGKKFPNVSAADSFALPPPGFYVSPVARDLILRTLERLMKEGTI